MTWQDRRGVHLKIPQQAQKFSERESAVRKVIPLLAALSLVGAIAQQPAQSQSIAPAADGTGTLVTPDGNRIDISGGHLSGDGANLFHSFTEFGLDSDQIANFLSQPDIQNILSRVVGGNPSIINGLIKVSGGNSNLFLMNPAGIIFGAGASLNVPADFSATTANGIGFGSQWFNATGPNNYAALVGNPSGFAFTMNQPGAIANAGSLAVGAGHNLTLLGGTVISTGELSAPGGQIIVAAVAGENLISIKQAGQLLNLEVQPPTTTGTEPPNWTLPVSSLPQLLTGGNLGNATGVTVNSDRQVVLIGSGLQVADGDVVARGVTAGTATLWANHNLTLVESQLYTAGDLQLLAADTVRVRDSVEKRFIAQAGGNLYVQGNQSIDILALNHPETPFRSGGNLSLISDGIISGDAHFSSGGNFSIRNRAGGPGTFFSFYDPIISSVGDVDFGDYTGASLKIEAKGNISAGTIVITNPDTLIFGTDPDISILKSAPALILRAGVTSLENPPNFGSGSYAIANLGTLGGNFSSANAINNAGQVVGESETASGGSHAVLWQDGKPQDLGTLPRGNSSSASGINNDGQIVGTDTTSGNNRAFLWQDGKPQDLGTLFGDNFSSANGINNAGQVVGTSSTSGTNPRAFLWQDGMMSELGMLPGGNFSNAYGINNAGQVVGISSNPGGVAQAVLWDRSVPQNLGTLPGGNFSNAYGINNAGQVVGNSGIGNGNHAFLWQNGVLQDLGTLPGGNLSSANSINNAGQVVGNSGTGSGNNRAFLWQNNWMSDLNELISPASGWDALQNATAINDKGQIVGSGTIGGQTRAFLMTPSSSPPNLSREGSITVGNISTAGGPVILSATGNINQTGAITSAGGEISLTTSGGNITTGTLNSSSTSSNGGDITLKAPNDIQVNYINAQGGANGTGGNVDISTENFFRATATFQDQNGVEASISTAGGVAGGSVIIQHGGGAKGRPFVVGDATQNGTAGAITTGTGLLGTIAPSQSFPGSYPYGNIQILTQDQPSPPPTQLPKDSSQLPKDSLLPQQNPLSQIQPPNTLPTLEVDTVVGELEDYFTRKLEQYLGRTADSPRRNLTQARETLQKIETATGVKPALIYVSFVPATVAPEPGGDKTKSLHSSPASALKGQFPPQKVTGVRATPTTSLLAQQPDQPLLKRSVQDNDQLELVLVTAKGKLVRKRLAGSTRKQVLKVTEEFFSSVTNVRDSRGYLLPAQKLYQWLVAPIEADLQAQSIQNLVFIMDTGLRLLPVAALHDRKGFLVERYSVGLMPSLSLSDTPYVDIKDAQVLAMGAEQFTDQPPLPAVPVELATITQQLWRGKSFLNEAFTLDNLKEQRRKTPFGIIHLASHGTFEPGSPGNSYIQLWDQKLKLDQLRQLGWNDPPVELLVLSACRTALGDEEAELGFAGLAVQAGVQSALASLWSVSDEGTLGLMSEFYEQLKKAPIKAEALRQTQLAMLRGQVLLEGAQLHTSGKDIPLPPNLAVQGDKNFTHPFYWAAFTMIGSPW